MFRNKKSKENSRLKDNEDNTSDKRVKIVDIQRLIKLKSGQVVRPRPVFPVFKRSHSKIIPEC